MTALRYEPCKKERNSIACAQAPIDVFHSISAWLVAMLTFHLLNYRLFFISIRIVLLPSPGVFAHLFDTVLSLPAKFLLCQRSIGIAGGDIACTAGFDHVRNLHAGSCFEVLHDVQNTVAHTSSQIVDLQSWQKWLGVEQIDGVLPLLLWTVLVVVVVFVLGILVDFVRKAICDGLHKIFLHIRPYRSLTEKIRDVDTMFKREVME